MLHALTWFGIVGLLAMWSLAMWGMHSLVAWGLTNAGVLAGASGAIDAVRLPPWLAPWIPPPLADAFESIVAALAPALKALIDGAPSLTGGVTTTAWVVWGVGSALLVGLGLLLSGLIAVWQRRASESTKGTHVASA